jgi:hypothetical protein
VTAIRADYEFAKAFYSSTPPRPRLGILRRLERRGSGLWVTDGAAGGTYELTGIGGAYAGGLFGGPTGFAPDFTPFDRQVLFSGLDANGHIGLQAITVSG